MKTLLSAFALLVLSVSFARSTTVTVVTNLPSGGTVTGGGTYTNGAAPTVTVQAFPGYYIKNFSGTLLASKPASWLPPGFYNWKVAIELNTPVGGVADLTLITNDTETLPALAGDAILTVTFDSCYPQIFEQPNDQLIVGGTNVDLRGTGFGRQPYRFQWWKDGVLIPGATNAALSTTVSDCLSSLLSLTNVSGTDSGEYMFSVSNIFGVSNSTPVKLVVKDILFTVDGLPIAGTNANVGVQNTISIQSRFPNGSIFYTVDGSQPDLGSTPYAGAFSITKNTTVRAIAYSADFSQSVISEVLQITIVPTYALTAMFAGGGYVSVDPSGPNYLSDTIVTVTAAPYSGWTFMGWSGDLSGGAATNTIVMDRSKVIQPIFGTTLGTTVAGNGSVNVSPSYPLYPAGTLVTFTAIPAASNYFALWSNFGSGNNNPLYVAVGNPTQTVSALFAPLSSSQATLTILSEGGGSARTVSAWTNRYAVGVTNIVTAIPFQGQKFVGWSGDVTGTNPQIAVVMDSIKVLTAHFTHNQTLDIDSLFPLGLSCFGVEGDVVEFQASTNAVDWQSLATMTNYTGRAIYSDQDSRTFNNRIYRTIKR